MAAFYSNENLWSNEQNRQVFNWANILSEWNDSLTMHPYVQTVLDNLKAASNPDDMDHDFPLSHFIKFLNWEREGLTWFLYEVVSMRYMWGGTRLDYVRDLVDLDEIHLDEGFPVFPGSPCDHRTVRKFLEDSLSTDELEMVDMMPALVSQSRSLVPSTPPHPIRRTEQPNAPERPSFTVRLDRDIRTPSYGTLQIRILRKNVMDDVNYDDIIKITKNHSLFEESYSLTYKDCSDTKKRHTYVANNMTRGQVLRYLSTTLRLLAVDTEPFESINVLLPNAPGVMLPIAMDSYTRTLLYDSIENVMDAWPILV